MVLPFSDGPLTVWFFWHSRCHAAAIEQGGWFDKRVAFRSALVVPYASGKANTPVGLAKGGEGHLVKFVQRKLCALAATDRAGRILFVDDGVSLLHGFFI